jgi:hypothetical protein
MNDNTFFFDDNDRLCKMRGGEKMVLIEWPVSQSLYDQEWFDDCELENGPLFTTGLVTGSSYWVPAHYLEKKK